MIAAATRARRLRWRAAGVAVASAAAALGLSRAVAADHPDAAADPSAGGVVTFGLRSDHHADAVSLALMGHSHWRRAEWSQVSPRAGDNLARIDDEARLGWRQQGGAWAGWHMALLARSQATLVTSHDALVLAAQVARGATVSADRDYQTRVRLRGFTGAGMAVGRTQALAFVPAPGQWQAAWEVQALALGRWRTRDLDGPVHLDAATQRYGFDLRSSDADNRLALPFQQPAAAHGAGLLLGGRLDWQASPGANGWVPWASVALRDGGWLRWRGLPQQQAVLSTDTAATDADGFLIYRPLIQGQNRQSTLTRWQPLRTSIAAGVAFDDRQRLGVRVDTLPGWGALPALTWQRPAASAHAAGGAGLGWSAEWRVHERRLTLGVDWRALSLRLGTDRLGAGAQSREWAVAWRQPF